MQTNSTNNTRLNRLLNKTGLTRWLNSQRLQTIVILGLAILLIAVLTKLAFTNIILSMGIPFLLVAPPVCWLLIIHWRKTFYLVVVTMVFEGLGRNLSNQISVLLFKDALLGLLYLGYLFELRWKFTKIKAFRHFSIAYACLTIYCLIELLNPTLPDISVGVIGLKTLLYYVPLVYIAYEVLDSQEKIIRFSIVIFIFTFITSAFGFYQFLGGPTVIQRFQASNVVENYGANGELVSYKIPATFASASNFSGWLYISFSMAMGLLYSKTSRNLTVLSLAVVATTSIMFVVNSQRAGLVYVVLCFMLGTFSYSANAWLRVLRIVLAGVLVGFFVLAIFTEDNAIGSRFSEFTGGNGLQTYLISSPADQLDSQFEAIGKGRLFGLGIGAGSPGARYVLGSAYIFVESFIALQLFEIGPVGLLLVTWVLGALMVLTWRSFRKTRDLPFHNLIFFTLVWMSYMLLNSITYAPLAIPPAGLFFWILPGMAIRLQEKVTAPATARNPFLSQGPATSRPAFQRERQRETVSNSAPKESFL